MKPLIKIIDLLIITGFNFIMGLTFLESFFLSFIIFLGLYSFKVYDYEEMESINNQILRNTIGFGIGIVIYLIIISIFNNEISFGILAINLIFLSVFFSILHKIEYIIHKKTMPKKNYLIIGKKEEFEPLMKEIQKASKNKIIAVEYINPSPTKLKQIMNTQYKKKKSYRQIYSKKEINGIIIADPHLEKLVQNELNKFFEENIEIEYLPKIAEKVLKRVPLILVKKFKNYYDIEILGNQEEPPKRLLDIIIGALLTVLFSPFMLIITIWTVMEDGFPVLFKQKRVGEIEKLFTLYKFRSLKNIDSHSEPVEESNGFSKNSKKLKSQKAKGSGVFQPPTSKLQPEETPNDGIEKRVLKVGKITRKTRLDETLQFINVIKGDMSIVGPRPEMIDFHEDMKKQIPFYKNRLRTKPGITGWAQIHYKHTTTLEDYIKKTEYDLYYVKNKSTLLDIQIMLKTVETMFGMRGAR
jgi:exopolysaccharide biosynthesis polyprenyl glycosylphosphotransferase